jgi:hypothetical protein
MARRKRSNNSGIDLKNGLKLIESIINLMTNETIQKSIFGQYSDGNTRSIMDSLNGEVLSPKQKAKKIYKKKKKVGKKKLKL